MTDPYAKSCDEVRLNLFLDGELGDHETQWMDAHLKDCPDCRQKATTVVAFTRAFRRRVQDAVDTTDFVALEKEIIKKTLPRYVPRSALANVLDAMKFFLPITLIAGFLLFFIYTRFMVNPAPVPSAIIESFSGSVTSVMIFETETRETILWYNEKTDMESENDAV
jgi:predicted anti-sigma-YlaC factor YlaD